MTKVAVVYHSASGHTEKMAQAVHQGVLSVEGIESTLLSVEGKDIVEGRWKNRETLAVLNEADAIIFGSPTYMGSVSAQMKSFMDATGKTYYTRAWKDKIASAFTVAGGPSGDRFNTLVTFATYSMQLGMIWVGMGEIPYTNDEGINRLSSYFGASAQAMTEPVDDLPNAQDLKTGEVLGARVAEKTLQFVRGRDLS